MATGLHTLEPWLQPYAVQLVNIAAAAGLAPRVSSARRSHSQQALLYRRFLAGQSRFPAAPPGNSAHELGLAFDLWVNDESQLSDLGTVWEGWGGTWGGRFRDPIHFEAGRDNAPSPELVQDPGVPEPTVVNQLNDYMNAAASVVAPVPVMLAQDVLKSLPAPQSPIERRAVAYLTDPIGSIEEPWFAIGNWITNRWFK